MAWTEQHDHAVFVWRFSFLNQTPIPHFPQCTLLDPKILYSLFYSFLLGITVVPREIVGKQCLYKFFFWGGGGNKVHFGQCGSGVFKAKKGSMVRGQIWDKIADNPHSLQHPQFRVTKRSVRERHTLLSDIFRAKTQNEKRQVE